MIAAITLGIQCTRVRDQAGIDTFTVHALLISCAFLIRLAANWSTAELRIARETWFAVADRMMILHNALGIGSTVARVDALRIDASLRNGAIRVGFAANGDDIGS